MNAIVPLIYLPLLIGSVVVIFYLERKIASFIQDRLGPTHVGKFGMLQPFADLLKLLQKEDIIPSKADTLGFILAPFVLFGSVFTAFCTIPLWPGAFTAFPQGGVMLLMALVSIDIMGVILSGWASNNKYAMFGAIRSMSQMISYEVPMGFSVLTVVILAGTLDFGLLSQSQSAVANAGVLAWGGIFSWNIVKAPFLILSYVVFYISTLAMCNRAPFDIPEAESELVAGFHVEYSGFRFATFFLAEYSMMFLVSVLGAFLYFGGWNSPLPNLGVLSLADWTQGHPGTWSAWVWGFVWLSLKAFVPMVVMIWIRWTLPRVRVDQLVFICWKVLTPLSLILLVLAAVWKIWVMP